MEKIMERIPYSEMPSGLFGVMMKINEYLKQTTLDNKLLELVKYHVSQINGCAYCLDMHYKEAIQAGESELRLISSLVWKEVPYYTDKEKAVLAFTEAVTNISENNIDDDVYSPLTAIFSKEEIANLTLAIAEINSWTRLMKTFKFTPGNYKVSR
jgi:AhpD family alkylhydroperoxidase